MNAILAAHDAPDARVGRITAIDKRLSLVLQLQSANRLSLHTSFITGIVHALVE
jgi:hypothetical protein